MPDTEFTQTEHTYSLTAQAAVNVGKLWQMPNGKAGAYLGRNAASAGTTTGWTTTGKYVVPKQTGVKLLDGGKAYWDRSASVITYKPSNDRDFYAGTIVGDTESADGTCTVNLNVRPNYVIDADESPTHSIPVGTHASGGFGYPVQLGGTHILTISSTNEAQKVDLFSLEKIAVSAKPICEFAVRFLAAPSGAVDVNIGLATDTHATDFDSLAGRLALHVDGGDTSNFVASTDGTTTVAATDTTTDFSAGYEASVREEWWIDCRNPADVQVYRNGALVLNATVFNISAIGEMRIIAHLEKTLSTNTAQIAIDWLRIRTAEQRA